MSLSKVLKEKCKKDISMCTNEEIYYALLETVQELGEEKTKANEEKKKLYYISAEFLIGKLLSNNLINLGIYDEVKNILSENGKSLSEIEDIEPEPSLGNGGLGRLAACFLDSIATLGLPGDGIGLNYHFGLFKQVFKNNLQTEEINKWIEKQSWLNKTDITYDIDFGDFTLKSRLYDINVTGYNNTTNKLHLFDVETVDENIVEEGIKFDKEDVEKNLTLFLYPDDSDTKGHLLRIYQQYFMVSNGARFILDECIERGSNLHDLYDYAVIQINDTHPTMVIPELIRLLVEKGIKMDEAIEIVSKTCAYTNHTILAEALEKWPIEYLEKAVPHLVPIIKVLDEKVRKEYDDESLYIIDKNNNVHMAHIDIHYTFSVNGVASLHTDILKNNELNNFYEIYPEKFNNKTNGITFRRWLMHCNPELTQLIEQLIGDGFKVEAEKLQDLMKYISDKEYCLYFRDKGYCQPNNYEDAKTIYLSNINIKDKKLYQHPTIKPLDFIRKLIRNSSKENDIVLDCFIGSGTTAVASILEKRQFIGYEINKKYFDIAEKRIKETLKRKDDENGKPRN